VAFLGLLALAIQSFVVQTHIHNPAENFVPSLSGITHVASNLATKASASNPDTTPHDKFPADDDPKNCPLCQAMAIAGHAILPAVLPLSLQLYITIDVVVFIDAINVPSVSHNWQSRGPPNL
jgi:hypothetical protein